MTSSMSNRAAGHQSFLIVFDFDDTVVNCNTDTVIPEHIGRGELQRNLLSSDPTRKHVQWTNLMDSVLAPFNKEELAKAAGESVLMDPHMPELFQYFTKLRKECPSLLEIAIASDANVHFIESVIAAKIPFAREAISHICSNPFEEVPENNNNENNNNNNNNNNEKDETTGRPRRCRVRWYEPNGHDCVNCNSRNRPNMCKSRIIARLLHRTHLIDPTIIFIGDGANDLCPIINILRPRDFMFARRGFPIHECLSSSAQCGPGGCCRIYLWSDATELQKCFSVAMSAACRLPSLVRFRDAGPAEFRSLTLAKRISQVLERTLKDNEANVSEEGRNKLIALAEATRINGNVAALPGLSGRAPAWLEAFARVAEFDTPPQNNNNNNNNNNDNNNANNKEKKGKDGLSSANDLPRWGQMPWMQGEVYFYNLVAQYLLLAEPNNNNNNKISDDGTEIKKEVPNLVTPYFTCPPISTAMNCEVTGANGILTAIGATKTQHFNPIFLSHEEEEKRENIEKNINSVSLLPASFFQPYRDYFAREKHEVLRGFLRVKIIPMLACQPWAAGDAFVDVLFRWMLWGNGIDLSMFTLEELQGSHAEGSADSLNNKNNNNNNNNESAADTETRLAALRAAEESSAKLQDKNILGNQLHEVAELVREIIRTEPKNTAAEANGLNISRSIDIVMDNVGVECVADLIFCLWVLKHHPSLRVTLHVKCMAYYVSDVTPPDFDFLIYTLEQSIKDEPNISPVIEPFVKLLREAFSSGRIKIDADAVWTQPCEYRELPPRVINTFFYTQRISPPGEHVINENEKENLHVTPRSALVIFKGDLNFRRLIGDRHWDSHAFLSTIPEKEKSQPAVAELLRDTDVKCKKEAPPFQKIISDFWPTDVVPVCAVRTVKSEGTVGISEKQINAMDRSDATWTTSGKYGVVLLAK